MQGIKTFVSTIYSGINQAYIYIWFSKVEQLVYVGQTNERFGTWGRGFGHFQSRGTLRKRCTEKIGLELELVPDLTLVSYPLPPTAEFTSTESSFRLAVEYLVQSRLYEDRKVVNPMFHIISKVTPTGHTGNSKVKELASLIVEDFIAKYRAL